MEWTKKRVLITVKAYPERSTKYGESVCVAGITDEGEFIRLYPVPFDAFRGPAPVHKYSWIEVECRKDEKDKLSRKESHKVRPGSIRVLDDSLSRQPIDWISRNKIIKPLVCDSVESLAERYLEDKTSIGIIKPQKPVEFYLSNPVDELDKMNTAQLQATLDGRLRSILAKVPHIFRYRFSCESRCQTVHDMKVFDWEVFESYRCWLERYGDPVILEEKMRERYRFKGRDLHFYMGMHSLQPSWFIIGVYYPPMPGVSLDDFV